ncbi:MAG: TMEM14 family protein [Verrucomicrobiota bacterium]|nr:TMEM14 family protein [Verrucomicrobiota bacterium]
MGNDLTILWIYIVLLVAGGVVGFLKAGSKASLIASVSFGAILSLFALNILPYHYHLYVLIFLLIFFGMRFAKSKKMMPNGLMVILTILALALPRLL